MYCPKCGKENPDDAQVCSSCGAVLIEARTDIKGPGPSIGDLAIVAIVGLSIVCLGIMGVLVPVLARIREDSRRITCATNLSDIGKAMTMYAKDYGDQFPLAGGLHTIWGATAKWDAPDRSTAFRLNVNGAGGYATVSSSLYLLIKYGALTPKSFVCRGDSGTREFRPGKYGAGDRKLVELWDFGPEPWKHCSYTYNMPYCLYAQTASREPGMAVASDRNPWIATHTQKARDFSLFRFDGTIDQQRAGNSPSHQGDGQNVLFMGGHVLFEERAYCAIHDDNIYTFWDGGDIRRGAAPWFGELFGEHVYDRRLAYLQSFACPQDRFDSLLVHDPPVAAGK